MRRPWSAKLLTLPLTALAGILTLSAAVAGDAPSAMVGFSDSEAAQEQSLEQRFDALLSAQQQSDWNRDMSSAANNVGTPHDKANADMMLKLFQSWGWDAHIETFYVLYPTPKEESLELVAPTSFKAALHEPP